MPAAHKFHTPINSQRRKVSYELGCITHTYCMVIHDDLKQTPARAMYIDDIYGTLCGSDTRRRSKGHSVTSQPIYNLLCLQYSLMGEENKIQDVFVEQEVRKTRLYHSIPLYIIFIYDRMVLKIGVGGGHILCPLPVSNVVGRGPPCPLACSHTPDSL